MQQLIQTGLNNQGLGSYGKTEAQSSMQLSDIISLSSFEIVKHLKIPLPLYMVLITLEIAYMVSNPAEKIVSGDAFLTTRLFQIMTANGVYIFVIIVTVIMVLQVLFIFLRGRAIKNQQTQGNEKQIQKLDDGGSNSYGSQAQSQEGNFIYLMIKASGIFLIVLSLALTQFFFRVLPEQFICDQDFEIQAGCDTQLRTVATYFSVIGSIFFVFLVIYSDLFLTKLFPDSDIPWSSWNENSRLMRNIWKAIDITLLTFISNSYAVIVNFAAVVISLYIVYERYMKPSIYNRIVHVAMVFYDCQLFVFTFMGFIVPLAKFELSETGLIYIVAVGILIGFLLLMAIDKKEQEIISVGTEMKNYRNLFYVELYVVVMLHELERLVLAEEYGQQKHIHAVISRHMEECQNEGCPCKNYEPEYDKKFTTVGSKKSITKSFSHGGGTLASGNTLNDLKRLPYKITYKTKVDIFKQEFQERVDCFLEAYPKSYGIKLLKSFFNHKYCDSSYKALFVQLENSITCKNFKGKVFIYHLKTQIQDEMKKSLESPLSIDINQLLRFEKFKMDFERNLEDLSYHCQTFWTDLTKEEYNVTQMLSTAYNVADRIMDIKTLFSQLVAINSLSIDTSSTYALAYRYILRDEATFSELVNKIQQIKNSSKLEQQREQGIRFFDSDIYALLMVSGDVKELGRVKVANSSTKFVFGYDPRDLTGSRINKLMPPPFASIHDRFLNSFLNKGKSTFLEKNQPLPIISKEGYLQMTLFYIKPMVSLHFGLIFASFAKLLNKYKVADDSPEYVKLNKLCCILTDAEGQIHGMSESCSKGMGLPPPEAKKQLSINENQLLNIQQVCPMIMQQEYEFELVKGVQMTVQTTFLNKERQYRREFPDIACKIGKYQAEVGVHKFQYRDLKAEINIFVIKLEEKDPLGRFQRQGDDLDDSLKTKSIDEELTYSEFSITTANSSVASSGIATSKFKTFKQKIQSMSTPSQILLFKRLSILTFFLLLGIAAGNFAINQIQNNSFQSNLDLLNNLQILIQLVPEAAHSSRELLLISNNLVQTGHDEVISGYYESKFAYYSNSLSKSSKTFEEIQNQLQTSIQNMVPFGSYMIDIKQVQSDGSIKTLRSSMQTSLNLLSSKILELSTFNQAKLQNIIVPSISFQWSNYTQNITKANQQVLIGSVQQELYYVIENGFGTIVNGLKDILKQTEEQVKSNSQEASVIAIALACVSIFLTLVLLPMCWPTLTHIEKISRFILMSLNRLPEIFCQNETKACMEIIMFINEQKEGEKSTHQMIKKHEHRKQNRQVLKLPKAQKYADGTNSSASGESDSDYDRSTLMQSKAIKSQGTMGVESATTQSVGSGTASVTSSKITSLSKLKASTNQYEAQQQSQLQRVRRNEGGTIELDLAQAKTSELLDEEENDKEQLSEAEIKQREKEHSRKVSIIKTFNTKKLKKFGCLIITALVIAIYFGVACFYLNLVHGYEKVYLDNFSLVGRRIQCYTNSATYLIDTLARSQNMFVPPDHYDAILYFIDDCYNQEKTFKQLILEDQTSSKSLDNFYNLDMSFEGDSFCQSVIAINNLNEGKCVGVLNGVLNNGLTATLFLFLQKMQQIKLAFDSRISYTNIGQQIDDVRRILLQNETNQLISLHEIYLRSSFTLIRSQALSITQNFFSKMNSYYNMLFGLFVALLSMGEFIVMMYLVKRLSKEIVKMYHVVLMIPFSGRTQNDLNRLMMIKL